MSSDIQMFGMSVDRIHNEYIDSLTAKLSGQEMVVMSILSDCQEMLERNYDNDDVRKQLNVAKYILSEMMDAKRK